MSDNKASQSYYQVGGVLAVGSPCYVRREADSQLLQGLRAGEFCYVLSPPQMGKSSLLIRTMEALVSEGFCCALIDAAVIASQSPDADEWYRVFTNHLMGELHLEVNLEQWWRGGESFTEGYPLGLSSTQKFGAFLREVLLPKIPGNVIIFIDSIETIIELKFPLPDFFSVLDSYASQQGEDNPKRINFAIFGVVHPQELTSHKNSRLFKHGCNIKLKGFSLEEAAEALSPGLEKKAANPAAVIREVLAWTAGQPFLTQKVCSLIVSSSPFIAEGSEYYYVEALIRWKIIDSWETHDKPPHLKTMLDRLFKRAKNTFNILALYKEILQRGSLKANDTREEIELRLSGIVVKDEGKLRIFNQIYQEVFNLHWVEMLLEATLATTQELDTEITTSTQEEGQGLTLKTTTKAPADAVDLNGAVKAKEKNQGGGWKRLLIISLIAGIGFFIFPFTRSIYLLNRANNLVRKQNYREAIVVYDKILKSYPESYKVWFLRGFPLSKMGRFQEMWQSCDRAISISPNFAGAWNCRGLANSGLKQEQQAISDYDQALQVDPGFYQAWNNKAESLIRLNKLEEAMIALDKAILAKADYNFAWNNKGNVLFKMGRYREAIAAYDNALSIDSTYPYAWNGRGNANRALKLYGTALSDYDRAILYKPDFDEALYNKSLALLDLKQNQEAIKTLEKTIEVNPRHLQAIRKLQQIRNGK